MSDRDLLVALGSTLVVLVLFGAVGTSFVRLVLGRWSAPDILAYAIPIGMGCFTFVVFLAGWAGVPYTPLALGLISGGSMLALTLGARAARPHQERASPLTARQDFVPLVLIAMLTAAAGALSVARSYSTWDAMAIYASKAYGMADEGSLLAAARWGSHGLEYPMNLPLGIMAFRVAGAESLPGSKALFPLVFGSTLAATWGLFRQRQAHPWLSAGSVLVLGTIPVLFEHGTNGYANLPFSFFLVFGILTLVEGRAEGEDRRQFLGGCLLALAVWTRPEGSILVGLVLLAVETADRLLKTGWNRSRAYLLPPLVVTVTWLVFQRSVGIEAEMTSMARNVLGSLREGATHLDAVYRTNRYLAHRLLTPEAWGLATAVLFAGATAAVATRAWRSRPQLCIYAVGGIAAWAGIVGFYWIVSYGADLSTWLVTGGDRMFLPAVLLLLLASLASLTEAARSARG